MRLSDAYDGAEGVTKLAMLSWDTGLLAWVRFTPVASSGGGGDASAANQTTEIAKLEAIRVAVTAALAVTGPLTDAQLRATPVPVSGTVTANTGLTQPLTDTQLRASAVPISAASLPLPTGAAQDGTDISAPTAMPAGGVGVRGWLSAIWTKLNASLAVTGTFWQATQPVSGTFFQATQPVSVAAAVAVTDNAGSLTIDSTQLPAALAANGGLKVEGVAGGVALPVSISATVAVSGPLTDTQLRATAVPVSGPLTDTQIRATALPVSGPLTDTQIRATALPVSGPLTDAQLRAVALPISAAALPLPAGAATDAGLLAIFNELLLKARLTDTQPVSAAPLNTAQGAVGTSVVGPMVQGLADDAPPFLTPGNVYPLSLSNDGGLRVVSSPSRADTDFWSDPFEQPFLEEHLAFTSPAVSFF